MAGFIDPVINALEARLTGGNGPPPSATAIIAIGGGFSIPAKGHNKRAALRAAWASTALQRIGQFTLAGDMMRRAVALSGAHHVNGNTVAQIEQLQG